MTDMPERIWAEPPDIFDGMGMWYDSHIMSHRCQYRRADLPPTLAQALELPEIAALVAASSMMWQGIVGECGYTAARVNFSDVEDALDALAKVTP